MRSHLAILHINTERGWRGGESQTLLLARSLAGRGYESALAAPPESPLIERGRRAGLRTFPFASRGELDPGAGFRLAGILNSLAADLVHAHTSHAVTLATLASLASGRRRTVASRRVSFPLSRNLLARFKYTFRIDRVLAVSEGVRRELLSSGVDPDRVVVVPSAIDLGRFGTLPSRTAARRSLGLPDDAYVVGSSGHLARHKGHVVLVEAARLAIRRCPEIRFVLVGRGEEESDLRHRIETAGLSGIFHFAGFREEAADTLPAFDLFAFPSLSGEGSPAAPKEAMACGLPIVASAISGVDEVVRDGVDGVLVPPGDATALADAILALARDRARGTSLGSNGRERSREYGVERMVDRIETVYRQLPAQGRR